MLTDVRYRLYADVVETPHSDSESEKTKAWRLKTKSPGHAYQEIFERRLAVGKCFHTPFLGWKEFTVSYFGPIRDDATLVDVSTVIPSMFRDAKFVTGQRKPRYLYNQNVQVEHGILIFPKEAGREVSHAE